MMLSSRAMPMWDVAVVDDVWVIASPSGSRLVDQAIVILEAMNDGLGVFMRKSPSRPVRIYLFDNVHELADFYTDLYGGELDTPYGWYEDGSRIIAVNVSEGLGPLAHEITHPYIDADFPGAPPWIDEGLASLFEASDTDDHGRYGFHNGRLELAAYASERTPGMFLPWLFALDPEQFYGSDEDVNYALARYFWLWLQEIGELPGVYQALRDAGPHGQAVDVLEDYFDEDIADIEGDFRDWVVEES